MDFLPQAEKAELLTELQKRIQRELPAEEFLTGIVHNRLGKVLIKAAGVSGQTMVKELTRQQLVDICAKVKAFEIPLTETLGMDSAQVTAGGVVTADFDPQTMQSKLVPGLYACGEVLDVNGDCGGYNLQWAWSSGMVAGLHAGGKV